MARRIRISPEELERRLRSWAEITEFGLGLRGAMVLGGRRAKSWRRCVRVGLADANRRRLEGEGG